MELYKFERTITLALLFGVIASMEGQTRYASVDNIKFQQLSQGLSQNTVTSILQDSKGFMWFGTRNGLNRYDGVEFTVYEHIYGDSTSLSNNHVNCLLEDSQGNLWVGTLEGGLNLFDRENETFSHFQHEKENEFSLSDNWINAIYEDSQQRLLVGTKHGGLNLFNSKENYFIRYQNSVDNPFGLAHNDVTTIFEDDNDRLWVGTYGGGIDLWDEESNRFIHHTHDPSDTSSIASNIILSSFIDSDGEYWLGTKGGLSLLTFHNEDANFKTYRHQVNDPKSLIYDIVLSISEDNYGRIWVGTENGGLSTFDKKADTFTNFWPDPLDPTSIGSNSIWSIFKDNRGAMWVGARNRGINKWDQYQRKFNHHNISPSANNTLSNQDVMCFFEDKHGNLWIGTEGGLNYYDRDTKEYTHFVHDPLDETSLGSNAVISLLQDREGTMWVGTWEGGLNKFHSETKSFTRYLHDPSDPSSISGNNIFTMIEDASGSMWIGVFYDGLDLFDREADKFIHFPQNPSDPAGPDFNRLFKLYEDSRGNLWVGTAGNGLNLIEDVGPEGIRFKQFKNDPQDSSSLSSNMVNSIIEDSNNNLWIGTWKGLNKFNYEDQNFTVYRKKEGLPDNVVHGVLEDDRGSLWISTNQGLSKFDPFKETFRNYDISDGLQAQEFIRGSYLKSASGELYFGGVNGFNSFVPEDVRENPNVPPIYITEFRINQEIARPGKKNSPLQKNISETEEIVLTYNQNDFSFKFVALNYSQANKNNYSYMLEGFDKDWQDAGTQRNVNYARVPQGTYTFKVRGANNDGLWNQQGAQIRLVITPPWWETWWAYTVYATMLLGIFLWYRQNLINRERLRSDLRLEHVELVKVQEMDQLRSVFFANISHEFRTPLTLILGPLRDMEATTLGRDIKTKYQLMIRNGERLLALINQLLDLSKLEAGSMKLRACKLDLIEYLKPVLASFNSYAAQKNIRYSFNHPDKPVLIYFDPNKLEEIITNLLSNAFKFTHEGKVAVKVGVTASERVEIQVQDSGIGIPKECLGSVFDRFYQVKEASNQAMEGTGIGLSLTKQLVELHSGTIEVESIADVGSTFTVKLPLGKLHLVEAEIIDEKDIRLTGPYDFESEEDEIESLVPKLESDNRALVLVVEDNADMRKYIRDHLDGPYRIAEAQNGREGLEKCIEYLPDLVVSDVMMPVMSGNELCDILKKDVRISHIPIILLTAKADLENRILGLDIGADDYVTKPFDFKILEARINNLIKSRELLREHYLESKNLVFEPKEVTITPVDEKFMEKVLRCIEENIDNSEFRVEDLGKEVGMSRMNLYRKIKSLTGHSAIEFIRTIRLKRAAQLLKQNQLTVSEVTYDVGFNDLKYFRNCFKKEFGLSPSQYARQNKEQGGQVQTTD